MIVLTQVGLTKMLSYGVLVGILIYSVSAAGTNLTCYQCEKHNEEKCDISDLKPCPSSYDRCAIHFEKNAKDGLTVKRECGLAPCGFDDEMMALGLGMNCDRSKDSFSCVHCCRENGCNKNSARSRTISSLLLLFGFLIVCLLNVAKDFIPPFVFREDTNFKN